MQRGYNSHNYTEKEIQEIFSAYQNNNTKSGWLNDLAVRIGRSKSNICRFAKKNGLTVRNRKNETLPKICIVCGDSFVREENHSRKTCGANCESVLRSRVAAERWKKTKHPRGMLGKKHSPEYCKEISRRVTSAWKDPQSIFNSQEFKDGQSERQSKNMIERLQNNPASVYSRTKKGWREFPSGKKHYFRSEWEMNYADYLEWLVSAGEIKDWQFEADTFWFEKIKRGVRSYLPDFKVFNNDGSIEYHEVKGWMDDKSATKLKRMAKYYPEIKLVLIDACQYKSIMKMSSLFARHEFRIDKDAPGVSVTISKGYR